MTPATTTSIATSDSAERPRPAAFAQLADGDEPALADAIHAATACLNSSESDGGS